MARKSKKKPGSATIKGETWWDGLPGQTQHLLCILVLLGIAFGFYAPLVFSGQSLIGGDTVRWRAMAEFVFEYHDENGEAALWAPNAFAGMPAYMISYAEQIPGLDDIPAMLRGIIWPVSHLIFLLLGTYLLVIFLSGSKLGGMLAAAAYGLTTYLPVILIAGHNSKFISLCFAPWLVLAFAYALRNPKLLSALFFAIALALNLRAGHVQITYYVAFLLGVWWIVELVSAVRRKEAKPFALSTGWLVVGSVIGVLMVAQPYLANMEYKRYTIRGAVEAGSAGLDWSYAMGWSHGFGELMTLIAADAFGGASPTYWGPKTFTGGPHYVGVIVLVLALLALIRRRRSTVIGFGIASVLMIFFALGENFAALNELMYNHFPLFNAFRVPETWLSLVAFALAVLAGVGLHHAGTRSESEAERGATDRALYGVLGGVAAFLIVFMLFGDLFFDFARPGEAEALTQQVVQQTPDVTADDPRVAQFVRETLADLRDERADTYFDELLRSLVFLLLAGAVLLLFRRGKIPAWTMQAALVLLVVIDLWGVGKRYFNEDYLVPASDSEDQIATYDFDQFIIRQREEEGGHGKFRVLSLESGNPFINARPSYHHESLGGYHGAKLRLIQDYIDHIFIDPATGAPAENALDLLNTRYIIARGVLPGTEPVYQSEQTQLYVLHNPDAVPRAFFVGDVEVVEDAARVWERIRNPEFDARQTAILSEPIDFDTSPIDSASTTNVEMLSYSPREIAWNVQTDAPRLLVVSEIFYPAGWKAYVDEEEVPIYRADHLLRAVPVPDGAHHVEMRFDPLSHRAGVWISGLSTLLVYGTAIFLLGRIWYRRREKPRADDEPSDAEEPAV